MRLCEHCHQPLPGPVYKVGRLQMDTERHCVYRLYYSSGWSEVHLEPQEYACLEVLMRRPGTLYSREVIAEQIGTEAYGQLVTNRLCTLRRKIGEAACIETEAGVGYRIVP